MLGYSMRIKIVLASVMIFGLSILIFKSTLYSGETKAMKSIYDFTVKDIDGKDTKLSDYKDKTILVVNVASKCGYTPQYKSLEALYNKYKDKGFVVLGFPCNQFGSQEPGTESEIKSFCSLNYGVTFPMFAKIDVNGDNADPLYKYLTSSAPGILGTEAIKWNFTKFLIDKNGNIIERYGSQTKPESLDGTISALLAK
jgi:glutathione peroxidase